MSELNHSTYNLIAQNYKQDHGARLPWQKELEDFSGSIPENSMIIDLGCGPGRETLWLGDHLPKSTITGVDFSESMISLARETALPNTSFELTDITTFKTDQSVDGIWARGSLHHLTDSELATTFESICSYLKTGGILNCINKQGRGEQTETAEKYGGTISRYFNFFNEEKIEGLAQQFKMEVMKQYTRTQDNQEWLISFLRKTNR